MPELGWSRRRIKKEGIQKRDLVYAVIDRESAADVQLKTMANPF